MALRRNYVNPYVKDVLPAVEILRIAPDGETRAAMRPLVGFLGAEEVDGAGVRTRVLYSDPTLENGARIRVQDIQFHSQTPRSPEDGLRRDVCFVGTDADVTFVSKRRAKGGGPKGGNGEYPGGRI